MFAVRDWLHARRWPWGLLILALGLVWVREATAQGPPIDPRAEQLIKSITWKPGPFKARLGAVAEVDVPANFEFIEQRDMNKYAELNQNPSNPNHLGALLPAIRDWVIIFSFEEVGYVKDDEKNQLDANALLTSLREGNEQANQMRKSRGWAPLTIVGWEQPPFFDNETKNLTWAIKGSAGGHDVVNYNSRILGRKGIMSANLIVNDSNHLRLTLPTYKDVLKNFNYVQGQRYNEFRSGDKVAAYGLAALISGGAVAVAAKSGLLGKLIKPIIVGVVALFGAIGAVFRKLFGRSQEAS